MPTKKIKAYYNLLKRCCKIIYGYDNIKLYNKKAYLIICSETFNNKEKLELKAKLLQCLLYETSQENLNYFLDSPNCKVVLIKNYELAKAILKENDKIKLIREVKLIEPNTK